MFVLRDNCDRELSEKMFNLQRHFVLRVSNPLTDLPRGTVLLRLGGGRGEQP